MSMSVKTYPFACSVGGLSSVKGAELRTARNQVARKSPASERHQGHWMAQSWLCAILVARGLVGPSLAGGNIANTSTLINIAKTPISGLPTHHQV